MGIQVQTWKRTTARLYRMSHGPRIIGLGFGWESSHFSYASQQSDSSNSLTLHRPGSSNSNHYVARNILSPTACQQKSIAQLALLQEPSSSTPSPHFRSSTSDLRYSLTGATRWFSRKLIRMGKTFRGLQGPETNGRGLEGRETNIRELELLGLFGHRVRGQKNTGKGLII